MTTIGQIRSVGLEVQFPARGKVGARLRNAITVNQLQDAVALEFGVF